ncbi:MAG: hypothetical protein ACYC4Q_09210, partial [Victivallaceae bacterium]
MRLARGIIKLLVIICSTMVSSCLAAKADGTWEVLLKDIPVRVSVKDAELNMCRYVLKQTHEPVFRLDDGENYTSRILENWTRDLESRNYRLCPKGSLRFLPGQAYTGEMFNSHISSVTKLYDPAGVTSWDGSCFRVSFAAPRKGYLEYLSRYENAPTLSLSDKIEVGLGEYTPVEVEPERVTLVRKEPVRRGYNKIVIHKYTGPGDPNLENRAISDFNRLQISLIPEWVKSSQVHFDGVILQTVALMINHPDKDVRRTLYNCMGADQLRRALYPTWKHVG